MKIIKTFEAYTRQEDETYPYPLYHNALKKFLPSVELFKENTEFDMGDNFDRFVADIDDFIKLNPTEIEENNPGVYVDFASNEFDGEGIDFLKNFKSKLLKRKLNYKVLVGGIPTPWMGGRNLNNIDVHGDTLYVYCKDTKENKQLLKSICPNHGEFNYNTKDTHENIIELLIKAGANIETVKYNKTPLMWALYYGRQDIVEILENIKKTNESIRDLMTPKSEEEILKFLKGLSQKEKDDKLIQSVIGGYYRIWWD